VSFHHKIRDFILHYSVTREIAFFIFRKKVYKKRIDKRIHQLFSDKYILSKEKIDNLVVSLTSFPERISEVKYTVYSLLTQTVIPEKIILWLATSQFPNEKIDLPKEILEFTQFNFEIRFCEDFGSYKKLIPTMELFPDHYIVTADDDLYYNKRWLEKLWNEHLRHPNELVCHYAAKITFDKWGGILPYSKWKMGIKSKQSSFMIFPCCGGGALFHKQLMASEIVEKELFFKLCPLADDIWFYIMAVRNNIPVRIVKHPCNKLKYVNPYREYNLIKQYKLSDENVINNKNDKQLINILNYFNINISNLIMKKKRVLFTCNKGGHYSEMIALKELFDKYDSKLLTDSTTNISDNISVDVIKMYCTKKYNKIGFVFGLIQSLFVWLSFRPEVIISTGSRVAVPVFFIGKLFGSKLIYIESNARVFTKSKSGKILEPICDKIIVQWPEMKEVYYNSDYWGTLV
jgi:hypothetical protein